MTQTTLALSEKLLERINHTANVEGRTRNNWAVRLLLKALEDYEEDPAAFIKWQQRRRLTGKD